jgi:hypothetical protein
LLFGAPKLECGSTETPCLLARTSDASLITLSFSTWATISWLVHAKNDAV